MKKRTIGLGILLLAAMLFLSGCFTIRSSVRERVKVHLSGPHTTVTAEAETAADAYSLSVNGLVFLADGDVTLTVKPAEGNPRVEVDCAEALVKEHGLKVEITGDKITVKTDEFRTFLTDSFHVTVYAPCEYIYVEGDYQVDVDAADVSRFGLKVAGAAKGEIKNIAVQKTVIEADGAVKLSLSGTSDAFTCTLNGAGDVEAKALQAKDVKLVINGAGTIETTALEKLDAQINGTGSIRYYGKPADVSQQINGMGTIRAGE